MTLVSPQLTEKVNNSDSHSVLNHSLAQRAFCILSKLISLAAGTCVGGFSRPCLSQDWGGGLGSHEGLPFSRQDAKKFM